MHARSMCRQNPDVLVGRVTACIVSRLFWSSNSFFLKRFFGGNLQLKKAIRKKNNVAMAKPGIGSRGRVAWGDVAGERYVRDCAGAYIIVHIMH